MKTPHPTQPPKHIRLTIPVTPEVREAFQRIAKASGMSTGRAMGEWLSDTIDAANFMADTLEKARSAPRLVAQQLHAYALGAADETGQLLDKIRKREREDLAAGKAQLPLVGGGDGGEPVRSPQWLAEISPTAQAFNLGRLR